MVRKKRDGKAAGKSGFGGLRQLLSFAPRLWLACAVVLALAVSTSKAPSTDYLQPLRRQGCLFHFAPASARLLPRLWSAFTGERGDYAVTTFRVKEKGPLSFVPNTLMLSKPTPEMEEQLDSLSASERSFLDRHPGLATALGALLLRRSASNASGSIAWLRALPAEMPFSGMLNREQRMALHGTTAQRTVDINDEILQELQRLKLKQALKRSEAAWALGFFLHHGLEQGVFAPGLLDGVARHWDQRLCGALALNAPVTGRLPGTALLGPARDMEPGEQVFVCSELPNGQLFAMYGAAYQNNPQGVALTQGSVPDNLLDSMLQQAELEFECQRAEARSLYLRRQAELLSSRNLRCSSVLWLGGGSEARRAKEYLETWPRPDSSDFREKELRLYTQVAQQCNSSFLEIQAANHTALAKVYSDKGRLSKMVVMVRTQELQLYDHCLRWCAQRVAQLSGEPSDAEASAGKAAASGSKAFPGFAGAGKGRKRKEL
ncbi:unnamed protein product [Effrenium voratum]|uniref:Uncharacterized protein n=1 Tax=Effrenium voratum TaxID=2562239 RepID=A0AA36J7S4_9DINO|nr:unnamed protein product [Effrenium voratum]